MNQVWGKIQPVVAELFLIKDFEVFFHWGSSLFEAFKMLGLVTKVEAIRQAKRGEVLDVRRPGAWRGPAAHIKKWSTYKVTKRESRTLPDS